MNKSESSFRYKIRSEFQHFLDHNSQEIPSEQVFTIDLHCHDYNSDVPDELWGRILGLPETWVQTEQLIQRLDRNHVSAYTITNHNNARSCWDLLDRGFDVLPGAEFTCHFEEMNFSAHVLAYGFSPQQEEKLEKLRHQPYRFLDYASQHDIPLILPHPLYLYHQQKNLPFDVYERLALMFDRFEVMNGQRDVWQNLLVKEWMDGMTEERLHAWSKKHDIPLDRWCRHPFQKRMTGGSDDHFALFAGGVGTHFRVTDLQERMQNMKPSEIALHAIRHCDSFPYGTVAEDEKLTLAFLDYFCQVAFNMDDPGLLRIFLHQGTLQDKLVCLLIGNGMQEMRRHRYTMRFLKVFHEAMRGRKPSLLTKLMVTKDYRSLLEDIRDISESARRGTEVHCQHMRSIENIFGKVNWLIADRAKKRIGTSLLSPEVQSMDVDDWVRSMEIPSHLRRLSTPDKGNRASRGITSFSLADAFDQLSFPAIFYMVMGGARFMSAKILHHDRYTVDVFAQSIGKYRAPHRVLWLTDTFDDKNGIASVLNTTLQEVRRLDLPIDFLVCSNSVEASDHLHVVPSIGSFSLPNYSEQEIQFPNLMDIHKIFYEGAYDRIVVSTELLMGVIGLYLKQAFNVKAYFYMHTDWLDYLRRMSSLDEHGIDRMRRVLRALYRSYDGVFVLNSEHQQWLSSRSIGIARRKVHLTAHWIHESFRGPDSFKPLNAQSPVFLFVGRLSLEKGILDLPVMMHQIWSTFPGARLRIAGEGVEEKKLRSLLPNAEYLGWVGHEELPSVYGEADFLLLPSRFDTFGCVVLEAMQCGTPVAAYNTKGPRDLIEDGMNGVLAETPEDLAQKIVSILQDPEQRSSLRLKAHQHASHFSKERIMENFLHDLEMER